MMAGNLRSERFASGQVCPTHDEGQPCVKQPPQNCSLQLLWEEMRLHANFCFSTYNVRDAINVQMFTSGNGGNLFIVMT